MGRVMFAVGVVVGFGSLQAMHAEPPGIVHDRSEPIFRITAQDSKDMLKSVPGILKDLASSPVGKGVRDLASVGKGVSRAIWWVDAGILAEDIGLELFDAQQDRQRVRLIVLDERATKWKARIDNGPPLSDDEKRLIREEFRTMMKEMETSRTRFVGRALAQPGAIKIVGIAALKHYGQAALEDWVTRLFHPGTRVKNIVFSGRMLSQSKKRILQAAWKALAKRQLEAEKAIDALFKYLAKVVLEEAAKRGQQASDQAAQEEREREARNSAMSSWTTARWNLAMRIEEPLRALPAPVAAMPTPVAAIPARVYVPADPVLRAVSVDYQVSSPPSSHSSANDDRPSTSSSYREERFYPRDEGNAMRQARSVSIRSWGGN